MAQKGPGRSERNPLPASKSKFDYMEKARLTVYLIRHGIVDCLGRIFYGRFDVQLSEKGRRQLEGAVEHLRRKKLDAIYSSPLSRALYGAELLAADHGVEVVTDERLMEMSMGVLEGRNRDEAIEEHPEWQSLRYWDMIDRAFPEGETIRDVAERMDSFRKEVIEAHPAGTIAVVAHNTPIRVYVGSILGLPVEKCFGFSLAFGGLTRIDYRESGPRVIYLSRPPVRLGRDT